MAQSVEELAYELSLAAVSQQESRANELRSRTGTLLAAAAVTASFFGSRAVVASDVDPAGVLALVAFLCGLGAGLIVLVPRRLILEFRGSVLLGAARAAHAGLPEAYEAASTWIEGFHEQNRNVLASLARWYTAALAAVGLEVVLWTASVGDKLL